MVRLALALIVVSQLAVWFALASVGTSTTIVVTVAPPATRPWHVPATKLADRVTYLHASRTDTDLLAAWNAYDVYVSRDAGKTFARVLDAPGQLDDVGFDATGNVLAIRDAKVGILDADGERWRTIPGVAPGSPREAEATPRLIDGGPDIVVAAAGRDQQYYGWLIASSDGGETWRYRELEAANDADRVRGAQSSDGTIRIAVPIADGDYAGLVWFTWTRDGHITRNQIDGASAGFEVYGDLAVKGNASVRASADTWRELYDAPDGAIAIEAPEPMLVANQAIYRVDHAQLEQLPFCVDGEHPIVDAAHRIWMIDRNGAPRLAKLGSCPSLEN
ncbi:MAG TPA: hypothetical protein VGG28_26410 [Kofleriaceae bacterium]|jgi:hypothetical protein